MSIHYYSTLTRATVIEFGRPHTPSPPQLLVFCSRAYLPQFIWKNSLPENHSQKNPEYITEPFFQLLNAINMRNNNHAHLTNGIPFYGLHIVVLVHYAGCRPLPQNTRTLEHPYTMAHSTRKNISTSMLKNPYTTISLLFAFLQICAFSGKSPTTYQNLNAQRYFQIFRNLNCRSKNPK